MPAPKRLLSLLAAFDRREGLVSPGDRILLAVSGGPDSVCLTHHLHRVSGPKRLRLSMLHIHHGLRGREADQDAAFVERLACGLGVRLTVKRIPVRDFARSERRSLEDAARVLRYRAFAELASRLHCNKVATGHQLDDQAETVLMHLLRGTKAKGLAGIPAKRPLGKRRIELIRPLLPLSRKDILEYLRAYGLTWRLDRTNASDRFTRNWVRRKLLPLLETRNPSIREHLAAIAEDVRALIGRPRHS
ncbi:MAG: tRNA lysidine(34) synthetase TilS [Elusimicrobiota bacterium]